MEIDLYQQFKESPELVLFVVLGCGYLIGQIRVAGQQLGATAGVLLGGLFFGYLGLQTPERIEQLGFIFFIYSVGLQAGPRFFSVVLEEGAKYIVMAFVVAVTAFSLAIGLGWLFQFQAGVPAGLVAGSLTSTPTLAAAQDAVTGGMAYLPEGTTREEILGNITVSYALTYLVGLLGVTLLVRLAPVFMGHDLPAEAAALARSRRFSREPERERRPIWTLVVRAYEVQHDELVGQPLRDLQFRQRTGCIVQKIKRGEGLIDASPEVQLESGDHVAVMGYLDQQQKMPDLLGPEVVDAELVSLPLESMQIFVTERDVAGQALGDLNIAETYGCFPTRLMRTAMELPLTPEMRLERGDVLEATGVKSQLDKLARRLGHAEGNLDETDLFTFAVGIAAGILLGQVAVVLGGVSLGIGTAGGLLVSGIAVGFLRSLHPTFGRVPPAARWLFLELGLLLFMASIGVRAGSQLVPTLQTVGVSLILCAVLVTLIPAAVGYLCGRFVLKLNTPLLFGSITGAMTSTPALGVVTRAAQSQLPALGYAGTYAFANVMCTLAGTMMMRF